MKYFLDIPIKWKLTIGFSVGIVSLILMSGLSIFTFYRLIETQTAIQDIHLNNVIDYQALEANLSKNRVLLYRMMRSGSPTEQARINEQIAELSKENDTIMARLADRVINDPLPPGMFNKLKTERDAFLHNRDVEVIPSINNRKLKEADAAFDKGTEHYREVSAMASELAGLAREYVRGAVNDSIDLVHLSIWVLSGIALITLLLSFLAMKALHKAITLPIIMVANKAALIGEGQLDISISGDNRKDEVGTMALAFNRMTESLRELANVADHISNGDLTDEVKPRSTNDRLAISFNIMSENLRALTGEMKLGSAEINNSTLEILELTREFILETEKQAESRTLQESLLRLEEVSNRLNLVVGQIKLNRKH